ncbi:hypothetical protein D9M73_119800 [compost metagenome]
MDGQERAQPGVNRMAKTQHAALPQQDVVAQADDDQVTGLRQHGECQAALEHQGSSHQQQCIEAPQHPAPHVVRLEFVIFCGHDWPLSFSCTQQAFGTENQYQDQQEEWQYRRHLRNRELEQGVAKGLRRHGNPELRQQGDE